MQKKQLTSQSKVYLVCLRSAKDFTQHLHHFCFKVYNLFKRCVCIRVWYLLRGNLLVVFYQWWTLLRRCRNKKEVCQFSQFTLQVLLLEMDLLEFKIAFVFGAEIMINISRSCFFYAKSVDLGGVVCKKLARFNDAGQMVWCVITIAQFISGLHLFLQSLQTVYVRITKVGFALVLRPEELGHDL